MKTWKEIITPVLQRPEMVKLKDFVAERRKAVKVFPESKDLFNAFEATPYETVRIVILGQDPYPGENFAHGIAFSTKTTKTPGSLKNIFNEIYESMYKHLGESYETCFPTNDLTNWCKQGVFLYNTILTVEENAPNSHKDKGWEDLTEIVMTELNDHPNNLIFMLWGANARAFKKFITNDRHTVLETSHPSPMSYEQGFKGCNHFSEANRIITMRSDDILEIDFNEFFNKEKGEEKIKEELLKKQLLTETNVNLFKYHLQKEILWNLKVHLGNGIDWRTRITN